MNRCCWISRVSLLVSSLLVSLLLLLPLSVAAQDSAGLVDKTVMVIQPEVPLRVQADQTQWIALYGDFVKVTHVAGDWLWIGKRQGYIKLQDVLTSVPALEAKITAEPDNALNYVHRATARNVNEIEQSLAELDKAVSLAPESGLAIAVRGNHHFLNKDYPRAVADLQKAVKLDPKLLVAQTWLARALENQGDLPAAEQAYRKTVELAPDNGRVIGDWGRFLLDREQLDEAIAQLGQAIEKSPRFTTAYLNRCIAHRLQGKYDAALDDINQYIKAEPDATSGYFERSAVLLGKFDAEPAQRKPEDLDQALADTEALLKLGEVAPSMKIKGDVLRRQGKAQDSLAAYNAALEKDPAYTAALYERAVLWYQNGRYENAAADISSVIELQPKNLQLYRDRAECLLNLGRYEEALADCETVLSEIPDDLVSLRRRGMVWDGLKQYERAIDDYTAVLETQPQDALALNNRGAAYTHLDQSDRAVADFEQAIAADPNYLRARKNLGIARRNLGDNAKSIEVFEAALALHQPPDKPLEASMLSELYLELAGSHRASQDDALGLKYYGKAIEANPENLQALNYRAWLQATSPDDSLRNGQQALADATKAAELTQRQVPDVLDTLAAAYAETGDFAQALATLQEAESLAPDNRAFASRALFYSNDQPFRQGAQFDYQLEVEEGVPRVTEIAGAIGANHVPTEAFAAISILPEQLLNARLLQQMPPEFEQEFMQGLVPPRFQELVNPRDIESVLVAMYPHRSLPPVVITRFKSLIVPAKLTGIEGLSSEQLAGREYFTDGNTFLYLADPETLVFTDKLESLQHLMESSNKPSRLRNKLLTTKAEAPISGYFFTGATPRFLGKAIENAPPALKSLVERSDAIELSLVEAPALAVTASFKPAAGLSKEELSSLQSDLAAAKNMAAGQLGLLLSQAPFPQASQLAKRVHAVFINAEIARVDGGFQTKLDGSELEKWLDDSLPSLLEQLGKAQMEAQQLNKLKQVAIALLQYESVYQALPAQASIDPEGKPLLSWRVQILPYMGPEGETLYQQFKLDEPWDSPHNLPLSKQTPAIYQTDGVEKGKTTTLAVIGDDSIIGKTDPVQLRRVTDGLSRTIEFVQVQPEHAVPWTKPADYDYDPSAPLAKLTGDAKVLVGFGDGHIAELDPQLDATQLNALFTKSGGEVVDAF